MHYLELWCLCCFRNDWKIATQYNEIILCPDNDKNGELAMHKLARHLVKDLDCDINKIKIITYDGSFPDGWDVADPMPNGEDTHSFLSTKNMPYADFDYESIWNEIETKTEKKK